jgi:CrcB protein
VSAPVWIGVGLLGGVGAVARFGVEQAVSARAGDGLRWGVMTVNLTGAVGLGVLHGAGVDGDAMTLAGGAFLGAFTTFSAWMLDAHELRAGGRADRAAANVALGLLAGLALFALGHAIGTVL